MIKQLKHRMMSGMSRRMISCEQATYLLSLKQEQSLGFRQWMQLKIHLMSCYLCRRYALQVQDLQEIMESYSHSCKGNCEHRLAEPDRERIKSSINDELGAG